MAQKCITNCKYVCVTQLLSIPNKYSCFGLLIRPLIYVKIINLILATAQYNFIVLSLSARGTVGNADLNVYYSNSQKIRTKISLTYLDKLLTNLSSRYFLTCLRLQIKFGFGPGLWLTFS